MATTVFDHLRTHLLESAGIFPPASVESFERWAERQWSKEFEQLMRNRMIVGGLRYGGMAEPGKPQYDRIKSIIKRLAIYQETGNLEMLVDCANLCVFEYVEGRHPLRHFGDAAAENENHVEKV